MAGPSAGSVAKATPASPVERGALGRPLLVVTLAGLLISGYLVVVRFLGETPACGPIRGCETVATSEYATIGPIPVALLGFGLSAVLVVAAATWWRRADRRALLAAYGLLLAATLAVAYLTYLELFVIHAICAWCVSYAVATVMSLAVAGLTLRRSGAA
jgi:uncharacterized membrane protein